MAGPDEDAAVAAGAEHFFVHPAQIGYGAHVACFNIDQHPFYFLSKPPLSTRPNTDRSEPIESQPSKPIQDGRTRNEVGQELLGAAADVDEVDETGLVSDGDEARVASAELDGRRTGAGGHQQLRLVHVLHVPQRQVALVRPRVLVRHHEHHLHSVRVSLPSQIGSHNTIQSSFLEP